VTHWLLNVQWTIDAIEPPFLPAQLATGAALGTLGEEVRVGADLLHPLPLDFTTEVLPQFVSAGFDHRVVRYTANEAFGPIKIQ
jgi:hypothetical protein